MLNTNHSYTATNWSDACSTEIAKRIRWDSWLLAAWLLTGLRLPLAIIAYSACRSGLVGDVLSLSILLLMLADILDGDFMRRSRMATARDLTVRHVVDAVGDRLVICALLFVAAMNGIVSPSVYALFLLRESVLITTVSTPFLFRGRVLSTSDCSKVATALMGFAVINGVYDAIPTPLLLIPFVVFSMLGILAYNRTARRNG